MILSLHPCLDADMQIILADRPLDSAIRDAINRADAVILPQACTQALYEVCLASAGRVFPNYDARLRYPGKIRQARMFQNLGLRHPKTRPWESVEQFKKTNPGPADIPHNMPFLIKEDRRHEAEGIFFVEDRKGLLEALDELDRRQQPDNRGFVTQEIIPCNGNVLRAVIVGRRIVTYWKRPRQPGQPITTISRGAVIDSDWRPDLQEKGKISARDLMAQTGINLAAVDLVFPMHEMNPEPFFLEVNYYFGRRGLGGTEAYYRLLYEAVQDWLRELGRDPESVRLA